MIDSNPYAAPAAVEQAPREEEQPRAVSPADAAQPARRAAGLLIDYAATWVLGPVTGIAVAILFAFTGRSSELTRVLEHTGVGGMVFSLLAMFAFRATSEWIGGATLGKLLCGMRVLGEDARPVRLGPAIVRTLLLSFDLVFFGLPAMSAMNQSPMRQRVGDGLASTYVVRASAVPEASRRSLGRTLAGIAAGGAANVATLGSWFVFLA